MTFRSLRRRAGYSTQPALAACTRGVLPETISQIERGVIRHPRYDTVAALASALGTSAEIVAHAIRRTRARARVHRPRGDRS